MYCKFWSRHNILQILFLHILKITEIRRFMGIDSFDVLPLFDQQPKNLFDHLCFCFQYSINIEETYDSTILYYNTIAEKYLII